MMNGKVVIDLQGNLLVDGKITAKQYQVDVSQSESASLGSAIIESGQLSVEVESAAVSADSKIFVTATTPTGGQSLIVDQKEEGRFTVSLEKTHDQEVAFDWWVVGEIGELRKQDFIYDLGGNRQDFFFT